MTYEASRTALTEWLEDVQSDDAELVWMVADLYNKNQQLDLVYDPEMEVREYHREPFLDVYVGFKKLDVWWSYEASMLGAKFFVVTHIDHAPYEGVCCFRFPDPIKAYEAKILLAVSK